LKLEILTPDKSLFEGEIQSVTVPGEKGSFMVLHNHAPIVSTLTKGNISILTKDYKEESFPINDGIIEVKSNLIVILADT
jgi:F-type H+-transporting ATPase subunit epsilon